MAKKSKLICVDDRHEKLENDRAKMGYEKFNSTDI